MKDVTDDGSARADVPWSAYGGLMRGLLPRAIGVNIYDSHGELLCATDLSGSGQVADVLEQSRRDLLDSPSSPGSYQLVGTTPTYVFWIWPELPLHTAADGPQTPDIVALEDAPRTHEGNPLAAVVVRLRPGANVESCSLGFVRQLVQPALDCLRADLLCRQENNRLRVKLCEQPNVVALLQGIAADDRGASLDGAEDLRAILESATRHLRAAMAALVVPDLGLALTHSAADTPFDRKLFAKAHRQLLALSKMRREPLLINRLPMPQGMEGTYRVLACAICRPDGQAIGVLALCRSAEAEEFQPEHAQIMGVLARRVATAVAYDYDALTGLLTRPALERQLQRCRTRKSGPSVWSALYVDVDRMQIINDTHGIRTGDRIISQLGELIRRQLAPGAIAARSGADRFAILMPTGLEEALQAATRLQQAAGQLVKVRSGEAVAVSVCVGAAPLPADGRDLAHALAMAETACKAAKAQGPNRVELYQQASDSMVRRMSDLRLVATLRNAIDDNSLELAAQLTVALGTPPGAPHFEVLLRMLNEKGKRVGPGQFMSAALRHELLPELDRWVIGRMTCVLKANEARVRQAAAVFTINVAGQSLRDPSFASDVEALINASGVNPSALCFELTEDDVVSNLAVAEIFMRSMRRLGCGLALDDFGSGLSSLSYLRRLPITMLKIDGSFIRDVLQDPKAEAMVKTFAQLARSMSLVTVAKHIESDEVCARVASLGLDYGQGFAIAAPELLERILSQLPVADSASGDEHPTDRRLILTV